ncbi:MAG: hypothetical protein ACXVYB_16155 [Arthrobacter sp.]
MTRAIYAETAGDGAAASALAAAAGEECDTNSCYFSTGPETD